MEEQIITHGAIKHLQGKPCKICERIAKRKENEAKTVDTTIEPAVPEVQDETPEVREENAPIEGFKNGVNERVFTGEQVAQMLEEVQNTTTHRIFAKLYEICNQKQNDLAFPAIRKFELEELEKSYKKDTN